MNHKVCVREITADPILFPGRRAPATATAKSFLPVPSKRRAVLLAYERDASVGLRKLVTNDILRAASQAARPERRASPLDVMETQASQHDVMVARRRGRAIRADRTVRAGADGEPPPAIVLPWFV